MNTWSNIIIWVNSRPCKHPGLIVAWAGPVPSLICWQKHSLNWELSNPHTSASYFLRPSLGAFSRPWMYFRGSWYSSATQPTAHLGKEELHKKNLSFVATRIFLPSSILARWWIWLPWIWTWTLSFAPGAGLMVALAWTFCWRVLATHCGSRPYSSRFLIIVTCGFNNDWKHHCSRFNKDWKHHCWRINNDTGNITATALIRIGNITAEELIIIGSINAKG